MKNKKYVMAILCLATGSVLATNGKPILLDLIPRDIRNIISFYVADNMVKAAEKGDYNAVKAFMDLGLDPNALSQNNYTALMRAAINNHEDVARLLVERGADVNVKGPQDTTALHFAVQYASPSLVSFLLDNGAVINATTATERIGAVAGQERPRTIGSRTPLMLAANLGKREIVEILLSRGANKSMYDAQDLSAADIARDANFYALAEYIQQFGEKRNSR